jgi:hypothetical protein
MIAICFLGKARSAGSGILDIISERTSKLLRPKNKSLKTGTYVATLMAAV